ASEGAFDIVFVLREVRPVVLANNGEGKFTPLYPFSGISGLRQFAWADLDGDGLPDATIVDNAGRLHVFINERQGHFRERQLPTSLGLIRAVAIIDARRDGLFSVAAVKEDGSLIGISGNNEGESWNVTDVANIAKP